MRKSEKVFQVLNKNNRKYARPLAAMVWLYSTRETHRHIPTTLLLEM